MDSDKKTMFSLKDVISNLFTNGHLPFDPDDSRIWKVWDEVVGPAIAKNAQPLSVRKKKLKVRVLDPIWFQELQFMEQSIREKLNEKLNRQAVEKIDFSIGPKLH